MMNLQEVKEAVDYLSPSERAELRAYLDETEPRATTLRAGTMDIDKLLEAARAMHEGLTDAEWDEITQAMNEV